MSNITDMSTCKKELNNFKIPTELVGGTNQLVKPYFDIDTELPKDTVFDEQSVLTMATEKIKKMFKLPNSKDIYILYLRKLARKWRKWISLTGSPCWPSASANHRQTG